MTARQYLEQHKLIADEIEEQRQLIETLRAVAEKTVAELKEDRVQSSHDDRSLENVAISVAEEEQWLERLKDKLFFIRREICENAKKYAPHEASVLINAYIMDMTLEAIGMSQKSERRNKSWAHDKRVDGECLLEAAMNEHPDDFTIISLSRNEG